MAAFAGFTHYQAWWVRIGRWFILCTGLILLGCVHLLIGSLLITQTNYTDADILGADQKHNMKMALLSRDDLALDLSKGVSEPIKAWFPHRTDGVVNPLWPWVAAWLAESDHQVSGELEVTDQDRHLFTRGRWFHVGWTLGGLIILGVACARRFSIGGTLVVVMLTGLGAMLPRAVYFQPEPIFYALFLITWFACLLALQKNSLWIHCIIGIFGGLAYLAKGSIEPLILLFIALSMVRWAWGWIEALWPRADGGTTLWLRRNHWIAMFLLIFAYMMTAGPRLVESAKVFGNAFHSYPGYWMWFDTDPDKDGKTNVKDYDFTDCAAWMTAHNTKEELAALRPEDKPSFGRYWRTHSGEQMLERLSSGTLAKLTELFSPGATKQNKTFTKPWRGVLEHRGVYLGGLIALTLGLALGLRFGTPKPTNAAERLPPETATQLLFVIGAFVGYSLSYGWYHPIGRGDRFMLSLYAPLVLSLVWACETLVQRARRRNCKAWVLGLYHGGMWLIVGAVLWRLIEIWQCPEFRN
jgi:hypothetical protein